ncbi:hypothetical protein HELRODRAFT_168350 [Helobdella robusta]|uniref:Uncharacterized protein n=1 Tax=Helobdella robusta TaxID=6412 RepID=T1F0G1_HELRO|nr:hypothetical protein HELRODRAFT_168350 [Helobdella robusta]ESO09371.1 hypothetical protein HELRODRAFT_168350 [Helobdella robusta]
MKPLRTSHFTFIFSIIIISTFQTSIAQVFECCGSKLLDSQSSVAIENGRPLVAGTYRALTLKICTSEPLRIQVWTRLNDNQYLLKWSYNINASLEQSFQHNYTLLSQIFNIVIMIS